MDIRHNGEQTQCTFEPRPDISSKFHEKFVAMQALGNYCLYLDTREGFNDFRNVAAMLAIKIADTKHEDADGNRIPSSIELKSDEELTVLRIALKSLPHELQHNLRAAALSGDMMNCAYKVVEAVVSQEMDTKLNAELGDLVRGQAPVKKVGFGN